jgi:hypothetical protein
MSTAQESLRLGIAAGRIPNKILSHTQTKGNIFPSAVPAPSPPSTLSLSLGPRTDPRHRDALARRLVELAEHLPALQRQMVRAVYHDGLEPGAVAALMGLSPAAFRSALRRLTKRMLTPEFALVALRRSSWPPDVARVASTCVLAGLSLRSASRELGLSMHFVRQALQRVLVMAEALRLESPPTRRSQTHDAEH